MKKKKENGRNKKHIGKKTERKMKQVYRNNGVYMGCRLQSTALCIKSTAKCIKITAIDYTRS